MEKIRSQNIKRTDIELEILILKAQSGDNKALEIILQYFNKEIEELSKYIKLPHDETVEELNVALIDIIKNII